MGELFLISMEISDAIKGEVATFQVPRLVAILPRWDLNGAVGQRGDCKAPATQLADQNVPLSGAGLGNS